MWAQRLLRSGCNQRTSASAAGVDQATRCCHGDTDAAAWKQRSAALPFRLAVDVSAAAAAAAAILKRLRCESQAEAASTQPLSTPPRAQQAPRRLQRPEAALEPLAPAAFQALLAGFWSCSSPAPRSRLPPPLLHLDTSGRLGRLWRAQDAAPLDQADKGSSQRV